MRSIDRDLENERWEAALKSAGLGVWDADLVSGTCFYSPSWKRMLGYDDAELALTGDLWLEFVHPEDRARAIESGDRHLAGETPRIETEFRLRHRDGHWLWVLDRGAVIERDAEGRPTRMVGVQTDISAQKQAEEQLSLLNERIEMALDAGGVGLWQYELGADLVLWDGRMREIFGIGAGPGEVARETWHDRLHPDDRREAEQAIASTAETGHPMKLTYRIVRPNGGTRHVQALARRVERVGRAPLLVGSIWDITDQIDHTQSLATEKERLRITLESIGDAVLSADVDGRVIFANPAAERLLQRDQASIVGFAVDEVCHLVDEETNGLLASASLSATSLARTGDRAEKAVLVRQDGSRRSVRDLASPIVDASGRVMGSVVVMQDVTDARTLQREMVYAAHHDALTGLLNRSAFEDLLSRTIKAGSGKRHALLFIDLDRFKMINDTSGHAAGDAVLKAVAGALSRVLPPAVPRARLGGDEFAVLLETDDPDEPIRVASEVVAQIQTVRQAWGGKVYDISASVGVVDIDPLQSDCESAMAQADAACYEAKAKGRNRVSVYRPSIGAAQQTLSDIRIAASLPDALSEGRLHLFGQEIRDLTRASEPGCHIEILARLVGPDGTMILPGHFIPAAERFGLMGTVDRWIIRHTLDVCRSRLGVADGLSVAINLSANTLSDPLLWPFVEGLVAAHGIDTSRLTFEITETAAVNNFAAAELFVREARNAGCRISLDDFGAGLSSFAYLQRFQIDSIKIDGAFVENLASNRFDQAVVAAVGSLARELGVDVVAERIEDPDVVPILRSLGIKYGQGYLFSRPQPLEHWIGTPNGRDLQPGAGDHLPVL